MPFRGAPLSARHITLGDLGGALHTLLTVLTLIRNEPFYALCCPPVDHWGVTEANFQSKAFPNFSAGPRITF